MIRSKFSLRALLFAWMAALFVLAPLPAFGHAALLESSPASGSTLEQPPESIALEFNERLESGLFSIQVVNEEGDAVTDQAAELTEDRRGLTLALPRLTKGSYTVSYRVVSADGHPVSGTFEFHVEQDAAEEDDEMEPGAEEQYAQDDEYPQGDEHSPAEGSEDGQPEETADRPDEAAAPGSEDASNDGIGHHHDGHHHHDEGGLDAREVVNHGIKAIYMAALLLLSGLALWGAWKPGLAPGSDISRRWLHAMLRIFLLSLLAWIGWQLPVLLDDWSADQFASLIRTSIGRLWAVQLIAAMLAFAFLARHRFAGAGLAVLLLAAKATGSHAAAAEPAWASLTLDIVHLLAAALWAGGLFIIMLHWRSKREEAAAFLPAFSAFAWISIAVLTASGIVMTLIMLPGIHYVAYTGWGTALLIKVAVVILVLFVAGWIRRQWKRSGKEPGGTLLAVDFGLALVIVVLAAVLSGLNPVPPNKPLHWHEMGEQIHMTAQISPNAPGTNRFAVKVWLPEGEGGPKQIDLLLVPLDSERSDAIRIPLEPSADPGETDFFPGFDRYDFAAEGDDMSSPGRWEVVVRVQTAGDEEYEYSKEIRIY